MVDLNKDKLPKHVAIIMDGNRRWAKKRGLPEVAGHDYVAERTLEPLVDRAIELGIPYLTFWAFSTENWRRDKKEVRGMMNIFRKGLKRSAEKLFKKGVRINIIGDVDKFPEDIAEQAKNWLEKSKDNKKITVCFGLNYGGRDEIVRAIKRLIDDMISEKSISQLPGVSHSPGKLRDDKAGLKSVPALSNSISINKLEKYLDTAGMPDPDLIIRTGGEQRLSGFMSWQSAYSELYFTEVLMPEFSVSEFDQAIAQYQKRSRRFGC